MDDIQLLFVGDVMLGRTVNRVLRTAAPEYPWGDTLPLFAQADFRVCNLESAICSRGEPWPDKVFHFRTDTKNVAVLGAAGINCVSLANNHTLDYGYEGLADTLQILTATKIFHAGAAMDSKTAFAPVLASVRGLRIAMLSFTDNEPQWEASANTPGVAYVPIDLEDDRAKHLLDAVRVAKSHMNLVIVAAHWGPNWGYTPQRPHIPFAHRLIDCGADIIFGHSGHVFQGIEIYHGHPILYCTGNFIDDYAVDEEERNDESFAYRILIRARRPHLLRLHPTVISACQAQRAKGERARQIVEKMRRLCSDMNTDALTLDDELEISFG
jgi:poly-gamma-glutamate capsule biosynthesis protein CapA/YwtB (metallophosphatase superfamily)